MLYKKEKPSMYPLINAFMYLFIVMFTHLFLWLCDGLSAVSNTIIILIEVAFVGYIIMWFDSNNIHKDKVRSAEKRLSRIPGYKSK